MPKGVQLSHDNLLIAAMGAMCSTDVMTRDGRFLHCALMFHLADLAAWSVAMFSVYTHVIVPMFTPVGVAKAIAEHQVTDTLLVPTMIQMLVDSPDEFVDALPVSGAGKILKRELRAAHQ